MNPKKIFKILLIIAASFIVLTGIAVTTLFILYPPAKIKALVVPHIEKALGRSIDIQKVSLSFYPRIGMRFSGLAISNTTREGFSSQKFVSIDEFFLSVNIFALLQKKLDIDKIIITKPQILVEVNRAGSFNFDDLACIAKDTSVKATPQKASAPALPIPLTLRQLLIINGTVDYRDQKGGMDLTLGSINDRTDVSIDTELKNILTTGELVITDVSFMSKEVKKPLTGLRVSLTHDLKVDVVNGSMTINQIKASLQKFFVSMSGTVTNFNVAPVLDLAVKTETIQIADVLAEIPASLVPDIAKLQAKGSVQIAAQIKGGLDKPGPQIKGMLKIDNGEIRHTDLPQALSGLMANIKFSQTSVSIAPIAFNLGSNPVKIVANIDNFAKPNIDVQFDATVNLDDLKNIIKMPDGNSVGGKVDAHIMAKGSIDPAQPTALDKMNVQGTINLAQVSVTTPAVTKPVVVNGNVNLSKSTIGSNISVQIGTSTITFTSNLTNYLPLILANPASGTKANKGIPAAGIRAGSVRAKLVFALAAPQLNANEFLPPPPANPNKVEATPPPVKPETLLFPAPLPGLDISGTITNNRLRYMDVEMSGLTAKISSVNDVMNVDVKANLLGGTFSHALYVDARNNTDLKVKSVLGINNVEISQLITAFKGMIPPSAPISKQLKEFDKYLFGKAILKTDVATNGGGITALMDNLNGIVLMKLADGRIAKGEVLNSIADAVSKFYTLNDITFKDLSLTAKIHDKQVFIEDLSVNSPIGAFKAAGSVGFDGGLDATVADKLSKDLSRPIIGIQNKGKAALGGLLGNTPLAAGARELIDRQGIPADKDGRVTLLLGMAGPAGKYKTSFKGFSSADAAAQSSQQPTANQSIKAEIAKKQQEVAQRIEEEKKRLADEAAKKAAELKAQAEKAVGVTVPSTPVVNDAKKKAADRLKKLF